MKRNLLVASSILLLVGAILSAYVNGGNNTTENFEVRFHAQLDSVQLVMQRLNKSLADAPSGSALPARQAFIALREEYKKMEFMVAYLDASFVKKNINGAPLMMLEEKSPSLSELKPKGLQVLEEMLFDENPEWEEVTKVAQRLEKDWTNYLPYLKQLRITDRQIIESLRLGVIRIISMGVTGFDTPMLSTSIKEAGIALESMGATAQRFQPFLAKNNKALADSITQAFAASVSFVLQHDDFDTFDRLTFTKDHLNPLYGLLLRMHQALQIETYYETGNKFTKYSLNYFSEDIFSTDFLDKFYYTQITKEKYTPETVELGKMLFFDPVLSKNNDRACASCHSPELAFTDGKRKSTAFEFNGTVKRNSPTLVNAVFADRFFYDLRADVLENQIEHVITDSKEFHTSYLEVFDKLSSSKEYEEKFTKLFPEVVQHNQPVVNRYTIAASLSAYIASISSYNSPVDRYIRGEQAVLSEEAKLGYNVFMGKGACGTCHFAPTFSGLVPPLYQENETEVLGVPSEAVWADAKVDGDYGRAEGVLKERSGIYDHSFKTPTVRNIAFTSPYMHNGVYDSLEQVIRFYNIGGGRGIGIDLPNQTLPFDELSLSDKEQEALKAFMIALSDTTGMLSKPQRLPSFPEEAKLEDRPIGGKY